MKIGKNCETIEGSLKHDTFCHLQAQDGKLNTKETINKNAKHITTSRFENFHNTICQIKHRFFFS
jgi:hypothetical protein